MPAMKTRWRKMKTITMGRVSNTAPVMIEAQDTLFTPMSVPSATGAVIIVGGNIEHVTRTMTTAIALETSKGDLALALALGLILMSIAILINAAVLLLNRTARRLAYA